MGSKVRCPRIVGSCIARKYLNFVVGERRLYIRAVYRLDLINRKTCQVDIRLRECVRGKIV